MNIFMKSLKIKNATNCIFNFVLFLSFFIFSGHYLKAAVPTVIGSIPDQQADSGEAFSMSFDIYEIFSDADNDGLSITVTKADDSALPTWLTAEDKTLVPSLVGTYDTSGGAFGVTIVGNYAYVADLDSGLQIIDVSTPSSPSLVGTYDTSGRARKVTVVGDYAYIADDESGLQIIDVSTPSSPSLVGTCDTSGVAWGLTVVGNYAYVADGLSGLKIIDVSTPSSPSLVGSYDTSGLAAGVMVVGNYAYVADGSSGLQIIDVSTPSSPSLVGTCDTFGWARGVAVVGNYTYVANDTSGLKVIDVSTPSSPSLVGTYDTLGIAYEVTVVGNYAYVADSTSGLQIIEGIREGIQLEGTPGDSDVGLLNLKATASDGIDEVSTTFSIDVITSAPVVVGSISDQEAPSGELFRMSFDIYEVFSDADNDGLSINVTKTDDSALPTWLTAGAKTLVPSLVGTYDTPVQAMGVTVVGNYAYVADHDSGLQIIDVSTPSSPSLVGTYETPAWAMGVTVVRYYQKLCFTKLKKVYPQLNNLIFINDMKITTLKRRTHL